jgi:RNA polymerase primary sigma factor
MSENNFYFSQIEKIPLLTASEERELAEKAFKGDTTAQQKLVASNLRFVLKIAKAYKNRGIEFEDLIAEGNAGLIIASKKFDPSKNTRFITYAVWWIRQSIQKALYETGRDVKIPLSRKDEFVSNKWKMASLNAVYNSGEDGDALETSIKDERSINPEENIILQEEKEILRKGMSALTEKEQVVITMRYGLNCEGMSLSKIGKELNYSKERIRQIEKTALIKLRKELKVVA